MIGIKQSLVEGIKKELPIITIIPKATKQTFKKKGRNLHDIKIQFLDNLSKLTENHTKEKVYLFKIGL